MTKPQKIVLAVIFGLPCVCCLGAIGIVASSINKAAGKLDAEVADAKSLGLPTSPGDLVRNPPLAESENAAPLYREAAEKLHDNKSLDKIVGGLGTALSAAKQEDVDAAIKALPSLEPVFELLDQATARPHCDFKYHYERAASLPLPELTSLRSFAKMYTFRAEVRESKGDFEGAFGDIKKLSALSMHLEETPVLISQLVGIAIESMEMRALEWLIVDHRTDRADLEAIRDVVKSLGPLPNKKTWIGGELVFMRSSISEIKSLRDITAMTGGMNDEDNSQRGPNIPINASVREAMEADVMSRYLELYRALPSDPLDWKGASAADTRVQDEVAADKSPFSLLTKIVMPVFSGMSAGVARIAVQRHMKIDAIDLFETKMTSGQLPAKLPVNGDLTMDPFTSEPLHYRLSGVGFVLYSLGPGGTDQGGLTPTERKNSSNGNTEEIVSDFSQGLEFPPKSSGKRNPAPRRSVGLPPAVGEAAD